MKKFIALLLILCLAMGLASCASQEGTSQGTSQGDQGSVQDTPQDPGQETGPYGGIDLSKPETVTIYFVGFESPDWDRVNDLVNEKLSEKVNTTINFVHVSFADFIGSYSMYLSSGSDVDLIYSMTPNDFSGFAASGAFSELSEDFLQTYMPLTWANEDPTLWEEVKFNGKIYGVPANDTDNNQAGMGTSRNLMEKYNYTVDMIQDMDDLVEYVKTVAAGEQGTGVYGINCQNTWPSDATFLPYSAKAFSVGAGTARWFMWKYNENGDFNVDDLFWYADCDEFMDWALMMADFYANGIYPSGVSSSSKTLDDAVQDGSTILVPGMMPTQTTTYNSYYEARGDELVFIPCQTDETSKFLKSFNGQRAVFPVGSQKMERTAIVLDLLKFDEEIHNLIVGGVEGEHYTLNADGTRELGPKAADYAWANRFYFATDDNDPALSLSPEVQACVDDFNTRTYGAELFPLTSFIYDASNYEAEIAVLNSIMSEYRFSFCLGLYGDDTQAKVEEYRTLMHEAGIDDVLSDYKAQYTASIGG